MKKSLITKKIEKHNSDMKRLKQMNAYAYRPLIKNYNGMRCSDEFGNKLLVFGSCDYLGFSQSQELKEAAIAAINKYATNTFGSQIFSGYTDLHKSLAEKISEIHPGKGVLLYPSGMLANMAILSEIFQAGDVIIHDRSNHISLFQGSILSGATVRSYRHNDMKHLKQILDQSRDIKRMLIVVDGVFSTGGDLPNLPKIIDLAEEFNAFIFVDEAHALGVVGEKGYGVTEFYNCQEKVDIITGTMSKAIGSVGGYIATDPEVTEYLVLRSTIHSGSRGSPPPVVAASLAGFRALGNKIGEEARKKLDVNVQYMKNELLDIGFPVSEVSSPIFPIMIPGYDNTMKACRLLYDNGLLVNAYVSPAVPRGHEQLRVLLSSLHTKRDIDFFLHCIKKVKLLFVQGKEYEK